MYLKCSDYQVLACPNCGHDYTHLREVTPYDPVPEEKRLSVRLLFDCEFCERCFTIDIHQHKGETQVSTRTEARRGSV